MLQLVWDPQVTAEPCQELRAGAAASCPLGSWGLGFGGHMVSIFDLDEATIACSLFDTALIRVRFREVLGI